jgi:hypothetical protein
MYGRAEARTRHKTKKSNRRDLRLLFLVFPQPGKARVLKSSIRREETRVFSP